MYERIILSYVICMTVFGISMFRYTCDTFVSVISLCDRSIFTSGVLSVALAPKCGFRTTKRGPRKMSFEKIYISVSHFFILIITILFYFYPFDLLSYEIIEEGQLNP